VPDSRSKQIWMGSRSCATDIAEHILHFSKFGEADFVSGQDCGGFSVVADLQPEEPSTSRNNNLPRYWIPFVFATDRDIGSLGGDKSFGRSGRRNQGFQGDDALSFAGYPQLMGRGPKIPSEDGQHIGEVNKQEVCDFDFATDPRWPPLFIAAGAICWMGLGLCLLYFFNGLPYLIGAFMALSGAWLGLYGPMAWSLRWAQ
jgi:hypothetical protein